MIFTDPFFLFVFLPAACVAFHILGRYGPTAGLGVILATSILFYLPWGWTTTFLLLASIAVNFFVGSALLRVATLARRTRIAALTFGQLYNFTTLVLFKYHLFAGLWMVSSQAVAPDWIIPAGISFYTFHQAAFLADAYAREESVVAYLGDMGTTAKLGGSFVRYAAFVAFFPQLVIGPITYLKEFQPQTGSGFGRIRYVNLSVGFALIAIGIFKKIVIADNLALIADPVFAGAALQKSIHPLIAWMGVAAYYMQLYFDFSGYSDIALGLARIFGIRYPVNFFSPLKAVGIIDYYRRWHMTLTRVISRFLFTPLSLIGTRFAMRRRWAVVPTKILGLWLPLIINFEVIGLWHGAITTFIVFGLIHGTWYVIETETRASKRWKAWKKRTPDARRALYGRIIFIALMPLTFALFRSQSLGAADFLGTQLLAGGRATDFAFEPLRAAGEIAAAFAVIYLLPNSIELLWNYRPGLMTYPNPSYGPKLLQFRWRPNWPWMLFYGFLITICIYYMYRQPPFLYQGF